VLKQGESFQLQEYTVTYKGMREESSPAMALIEAELAVTRGDKPVGTLLPQKRIYAKFEKQQFAEVSVIPGLGDELYATLLGPTEDGGASVMVNVNPLVNWIWIGGTLMALFPFLGMRRWRKASPSPR